MLKSADELMYKVKNASKNRVFVESIQREEGDKPC